MVSWQGEVSIAQLCSSDSWRLTLKCWQSSWVNCDGRIWSCSCHHNAFSCSSDDG